MGGICSASSASFSFSFGMLRGLQPACGEALPVGYPQ